MNTVIKVENLSKNYKHTKALDQVNLAIEKNTIYGLLGRNGAGKTTLMSIITAQNFASSGKVLVLGQEPYENAKALANMCFVRESQRYPEDANAKQAFKAARLFFKNWDETLAQELIKEFDLPLKTTIKKLSRGQLSMVGIIIGLAARAPITFFDEPYLGLDAVARQIFYDRLIADYAEHPRTVIISSHLIDEIAPLIERAIVINHGKIVLDENVDDLRGRATALVGNTDALLRAIGEREILHHEQLGKVSAITVLGSYSPAELAELAASGIECSNVSLQQLIVRLTQHEHNTDSKVGA